GGLHNGGHHGLSVVREGGVGWEASIYVWSTTSAGVPGVLLRQLRIVQYAQRSVNLDGERVGVGRALNNVNEPRSAQIWGDGGDNGSRGTAGEPSLVHDGLRMSASFP